MSKVIETEKKKQFQIRIGSLVVQINRINSLLLKYVTFFAIFVLLLPPQNFGPEAKTRGGIIVSPAYTYEECVKYRKYWCIMSINPDLKKLGAHGGPG